jgi:flagellar biosynthesis chaperone FliJ
MKYPLNQLASIKQKRLEEAERLFAEKKAALVKEEAKLKELEAQRNEVKTHRAAKLQQVREALDAGTAPQKIITMRQYLKTVDERLKHEEQKVQQQKKAVDAAETAVQKAREDWQKKQKDVEKLKIHYKEWQREEKVAEDYREGVEGDEMGSSLHGRKKRIKRDG